jgi:hypothetical protein
MTVKEAQKLDVRIVPFCSTSNPGTTTVKTTKAAASQAQLKSPPKKPGRKRKKHQSCWYPRKQKKEKRKSRIQDTWESSKSTLLSSSLLPGSRVPPKGKEEIC